MSDPFRSTARRRAQVAPRPPRVCAVDDTDETEPAEPPAPEHTLREVLADQNLDTAVAVAADKLLEEIAARGRAQDERIAELERGASLWRRARAVVGTVSAAGVLSALAVVAAQLISHGDAQATARQRDALLRSTAAHVAQLQDQISTLRLQVTADHTTLSICATHLGVVPQGAP